MVCGRAGQRAGLQRFYSNVRVWRQENDVEDVFSTKRIASMTRPSMIQRMKRMHSRRYLCGSVVSFGARVRDTDVERFNGSSFVVIEQDASDQNKTDGPDPGEDAARAVFRRQAKFEPTGPAGDDAEGGEGNMTEFDQKFVFDVSEGVRMREQNGATEGANGRKNEAGGLRADAVRYHRPFKNGEGGNKHHDEAMLKDVWRRETFPKAVGAERPIFRIGAQEEKDSEAQKQQGPMAGPGKMAGTREKGQQADAKYDHTCPVVVVLRPGNVSGAGHRGSALAGNKGFWNRRTGSSHALFNLFGGLG